MSIKSKSWYPTVHARQMVKDYRSEVSEESALIVGVGGATVKYDDIKRAYI